MKDSNLGFFLYFPSFLSSCGCGADNTSRQPNEQENFFNQWMWSFKVYFWQTFYRSLGDFSPSWEDFGSGFFFQQQSKFKIKTFGFKNCAVGLVRKWRLFGLDCAQWVRKILKIRRISFKLIGKFLAFHFIEEDSESLSSELFKKAFESFINIPEIMFVELRLCTKNLILVDWLSNLFRMFVTQAFKKAFKENSFSTKLFT